MKKVKENIQQLTEEIEGIKQSIKDGEYIKIMNILKNLNNSTRKLFLETKNNKKEKRLMLQNLLKIMSIEYDLDEHDNTLAHLSKFILQFKLTDPNILDS